MRPGQHQILRIETHSKLEARLVAHVRGVTRPPTARPVDPSVVSVHPPVELGAIVPLSDPVDLGSVRDTINRTRPTGRGRRPGEAIDVLLAGPPSYGSAEQWSDARELDWARESFAWLRDLVGPDSVIVTAALHRDETSPHVQAVIVPIHEGRLGWTGVKKGAVRKAISAGSTSRLDYGRLQDWYQDAVGSRFGLGRGKVGSSATHERPDRAKALEAREFRARRSAEALEAEAEVYREETGERSDRVLALEERERGLRREISILEEESREAREQRDRDVTAASEARVQREAEQSAGWAWLRRLGRGDLAQRDETIAAQTAELDAVRATLAERAGALLERTRERDRALARRAGVSALARRLRARWHQARREVEVVRESRARLVSGLLRQVVTGIERVCARAGADLASVPGMRSVLRALGSGDVRAFNRAVEAAELPASAERSPGPSRAVQGRSGGVER